MFSDRALTLATELRDVLATEVAESEAQNGQLTKLALAELLKRAAAREVFNAHAAKLQAELQVELANPAAGAIPALGATELFAELHRLANALKIRDARNLTLAQKTLTFVRAYLSFLSPRPSAYDRRGLVTPAGSAAASVSGRA
jgi:hypothetical protein